MITSRQLAADEWSHIVATYDGSGKAVGVALYVSGEKQNVEVEFDKLKGSTSTDQPFRIGGRSADSPLHAAVTDVRLFQHVLSPQESEALFQASLRQELSNVKLNAIADAIRRVLMDSALHAELRQKGLKRVHEFSWDRSVRRVREIYEEVLRG